MKKYNVLWIGMLVLVFCLFGSCEDGGEKGGTIIVKNNHSFSFDVYIDHEGKRWAGPFLLSPGDTRSVSASYDGNYEIWPSLSSAGNSKFVNVSGGRTVNVYFP